MVRTLLRATCIFILVFASIDRVSAALTIQGYSPDMHERFSGTSFIGDGLDLSGISTGRPAERPFNIWATMISPSFFLTATHNAPDIGHQHTFYETNSLAGPSVTRTVVSGSSLDGSDLWLGRFDAAVPTSIATYAIAIGDLTGVPINVIGASSTIAGQRMGRNVIDAQIQNVTNVPPDTDLIGDIYLFDYDSPGGVGADEAVVVAGDSGAPSFTLVGSTIAITGIHWLLYNVPNGELPPAGTDAASGSGDTQAGLYSSQINAAMFGSGESASFIAVPEPASLALVLSTAGMAWMHRVRKTRQPRDGMCRV